MRWLVLLDSGFNGDNRDSMAWLAAWLPKGMTQQ